MLAGNKRRYPVVVFKDEDSDFSVVIPDLPGCYAAGASVEDALDEAHGAALVMVEELLAAKEPVPQGRRVQDIDSETIEGARLVSLIDIIIPGESKRINIVIDSNILEVIDSVTNNRSRFLTEAARSRLMSESVGR